jgi:hypothetical protein
MSEAAARLWDVITKLAGALGLIAGGFWTVKQYFDNQAKERDLARERARSAEAEAEKERNLARERAKSAEVEARKPFFTKQLELYFQAVEAASAIASGPWEQQVPVIGAFWRLYWGPLVIVEDTRVSGAMVQFGKALDSNATQGELKIYALELARACRDSIAESWKVPLSSIDASRFESQ